MSEKHVRHFLRTSGPIFNEKAQSAFWVDDFIFMLIKGHALFEKVMVGIKKNASRTNGQIKINRDSKHPEILKLYYLFFNNLPPPLSH